MLVDGAVPSVFTFAHQPGSAKNERRPPRERPAPYVHDKNVASSSDDEEHPLDLTIDAESMDFQSAEVSLAEQVSRLQEQVERLEAERNSLLSHAFCADRILEDPEKLQFYTGFSSRMFMACF